MSSEPTPVAADNRQPNGTRGLQRTGRPRACASLVLSLIAAILSAPVGAQTISTVAGSGGAQPVVDGSPATSVGLSGPLDVAVDANGAFVIADLFRIRRVSSSGNIATVAGNGDQVDDGQERPALMAGMDLRAIALDAAGTIYLADGVNHRIRKIGADGIIRTIAGTGEAGFSGDGGPAIGARINFPQGVAVAADGSVLFSDSFNNRVRRIGIDGVIQTIAGSGSPDGPVDAIPAVQTSLATPKGLAIGADGAIYIADSLHDRIRRIDPDGIVSTVVGGGPYDTDPVATSVRLAFPTDVDVDAAGNLYVIDAYAPQVIRVQPDGRLTAYAGRWYGFGGDGGNAIDALFNQAARVAVAADGSTLIADTDNKRIRRVTPVPPAGHLVGANVFAPYTSIVVPSPISSVVVGDVTGDRRPDVVLSTSGTPNGTQDSDTSVFVLRQQDDGQLASPVGARFDPTQPYAPGGLLLADLNKDLVNEIVVGRSTGLTVFRGGSNVVGSAFNGVRIDSTTPSRGAMRLVAVDADRDGLVDVAALGAGITIYHGNGRGSFARQSFLAVPGDFGNEMAVGDLTGDTLDDLVLTSSNNGQSVLLVYPGAASGGFASPQSYPLVGGLSSIYGIALADFDGDLKTDVALSSTSAGNPGAVYVLRQVDGTLAAPVRINSYEYPILLHATDLDRDTRMDLLVLHPPYGVGFVRQLPGNTFDEEIKYPISQSFYNQSARFAVGDLNGDGCDDVVTSNPERLNILRSAGCRGASDLALEVFTRVPETGTVLSTFGLVNRGHATIHQPLLTAIFAVQSGTVTVDSVPGTCALRSVQPMRVEVECLAADLADGQRQDVEITSTVAGSGPRPRVAVEAEVMSDTIDLDASNNRFNRRVDPRAPSVPDGPRPPRSPRLGGLP